MHLCLELHDGLYWGCNAPQLAGALSSMQNLCRYSLFVSWSLQMQSARLYMSLAWTAFTDPSQDSAVHN
jgi:hypothetical protein